MSVAAPLEESQVLLARQGAVAILTLNRPARRNAFGLPMRQALYAHLLQLADDPTCGAIVLTGSGGQFCAGGDIGEMRRRSPVEARVRMDLPTRIFKLLAAGPKPYLVAVEGNASGAGLSLVAASDYAVAAQDARFTCSFLKVGLIPDVGGLWSLPRKLGQRRAMEVCALGEPFDAASAQQWGLVNQVCAPGQALAEAVATARRFAELPATAFALLKSALRTGSDTLDQAVNTEVAYQGLLMDTDDYAEAIAGFQRKHEKKSPS